MRRFVLMAAIIMGLSAFAAPRAHAAIFEPQHDWWSSGRTCVDSRNPPGLAWDDPVPRACVAGAGRARVKAGDFGKQADYALASAAEGLADKVAEKI